MSGLGAGTNDRSAGVPGHGGPVVVGVDGSQESYRALDWAARYAAERQLALRLVHAYGGSGARALAIELAAQSAGSGHVAEASQVLEVARGYARSVTDDTVKVETALYLGSAAGALRDESRGATLVVLGSRGHGAITGLLLGSVSVPVSAHAECPVVVARGSEARPVTAEAPVVVGVDGSDCSTAAVGFAMAEAHRVGCPLVAALAWDEVWIGAPELAAVLPTTEEQHQEAVRTVSRTLASWSDSYPDVPVTRVVSRGRASDVLLREAAGARLVVVGSRGHGGFTGLLLGSTSQALLHKSPVDVAVVRS